MTTLCMYNTLHGEGVGSDCMHARPVLYCLECISQLRTLVRYRIAWACVHAWILQTALPQLCMQSCECYFRQWFRNLYQESYICTAARRNPIVSLIAIT